MKYLLILLLIVATSFSYANQPVITQLDTDEGYPYKNLIKKVERVEIRYVENSHSVTCKVNVQTLHNQYMGKEQKVSAKLFAKRPMAACLTREKAKQILHML
ncbi:hypothetical protein NCCP2140_23150 [Pseudoalteromonas sp. NCCP-2140]|uniref:hypothetical protein n=1 Tax=Pseudoalteromonas sp. NCCP-2140 TaxID=2942288 RepID=UPI00203C8568|nr:hypothetical protein [Pseudoalteromonas sp. NCCP-2140]GKW53262.1 hypothetical protein NCCP2140_23150 [Pseudoalteromonas sp. NCCP-2140]